jgi:hypothetical protein
MYISIGIIVLCLVVIVFFKHPVSDTVYVSTQY